MGLKVFNLLILKRVANINSVTRYLLIVVFGAFLSACGSSDGGSSFTLGVGSGEEKTGEVSIGISDAPVDDAKEIVVEIDSVIFKRSGEDDITVETFTVNGIDMDSVSIDLLQYRGKNQLIIIDKLEVPAGEYSGIELEILDEDINHSFVRELDDEDKEIKVPSDRLKLGGFTVNAIDEPEPGETQGPGQTFTLEFNLRKALTYNPSPDRYILKPNGIRIQDNADDSRLFGDVIDETIFNSDAGCSGKVIPETFNVAYLYPGVDLDVSKLVDVFDPDVNTTALPSGAIVPFAVQSLVLVEGVWRYDFAFLPAGDYTLVFSCNADDDPEDYDGLTLPLPAEQIKEITLSSGADTSCDLPIVSEACS